MDSWLGSGIPCGLPQVAALRGTINRRLPYAAYAQVHPLDRN